MFKNTTNELKRPYFGDVYQLFKYSIGKCCKNMNNYKLKIFVFINKTCAWVSPFLKFIYSFETLFCIIFQQIGRSRCAIGRLLLTLSMDPRKIASITNKYLVVKCNRTNIKQSLLTGPISL